MRMIKGIDGYTVIFTDTNICIKDTYMMPYTDINKFVFDLKTVINSDPELSGLYHRSSKSWEKEIAAHIRLYKIGLFKLHTKDTDLDENENIFRLIGYNILSLL